MTCAQCPVRDRAACAALGPADRAELARLGRHRKLIAGEALFHAGDRSAACATLVSGLLKVSRISADGTETILALVHPAGFIGELFAPFEDHDVVALAPSEVCLFSTGDYARTMERHPELGLALLRRAQEDLHAARDLLDLSHRPRAQERVAGLLLALARAASESPCHPAALFDLPLTRGEMAAMLGLTIETVSRQIGELERLGTIRRQGRKRMELRDPASLAALAA